MQSPNRADQLRALTIARRILGIACATLTAVVVAAVAVSDMSTALFVGGIAAVSAVLLWDVHARITTLRGAGPSRADNT